MNLPLRSLDSLLDKSGTDRAGTRDFPVLSITMKNGLVDQSKKFKKRIASLDTTKYRVAYKNELVVGFPIDEGVLGFQTKYPAGIVSPAYDIWSLKDPKETHIPYVERYLRSTQARHVYASRMQGAVARRRSLKKEDFLSIEIPFPPIEDQKRIAHLLGKVENLIAQRKQHLQQLDYFLKSVFLEMFGDPVRNDKGWERKTIGELATEVKYGTSASAQGGPYKYLRMNNITQNGYWDFDSLKYINVSEKDFGKYSLKKGDLVFNRTNSKELVGKAAVYDRDEPVIIAGYLIRVRFDEHTNPWFVWGHLNSKYGKSRLFNLCRNIVGMANINAKELQAIPILNPPADLQNLFAAIVGKVEKVKVRYRESLTDLESLYGTLCQQAFKGELDLSKESLPESRITTIDRSETYATSEETWKASKAAIDQLNSFNDKHSAILKAFQESPVLACLDSPAFKAAQEMAEQVALWRTPLDELRNMSAVVRATEMLASLHDTQQLAQQMASITEATKLAKQIEKSLPKIDMGWLKEQQDLIETATKPFAEMQRAWGLSEDTMRSLTETDSSMRALQATLPSTTNLLGRFPTTPVLMSREDDDEPRYIFTRHDILQALSEDEPLSLNRLMEKLTELESITQQGYERIKKLVFELLNEGEIEQHYNDENNCITLKALA